MKSFITIHHEVLAYRAGNIPAWMGCALIARKSREAVGREGKLQF